MDIALLAPVPLEHLIEGEKTCARAGKVAFGTRAFEPFARLRDANAQECSVYIYASHANELGPPKAGWKARYLGFVEAKNGAHPDGMTFRPLSTGQYATDNKGHWYLFWEVTDLVRLSESQAMRIDSMRGYDRKSNYRSNFIPERPVVIRSLE